MFDWLKSTRPLTKKSADHARVGGPQIILEELRGRIPKYIDDADNGKLIYPACKRALSDKDGDVRSVRIIPAGSDAISDDGASCGF